MLKKCPVPVPVPVPFASVDEARKGRWKTDNWPLLLPLSGVIYKLFAATVAVSAPSSKFNTAACLQPPGTRQHRGPGTKQVKNNRNSLSSTACSCARVLGSDFTPFLRFVELLGDNLVMW